MVSMEDLNSWLTEMSTDELRAELAHYEAEARSADNETRRALATDDANTYRAELQRRGEAV